MQKFQNAFESGTCHPAKELISAVVSKNRYFSKFLFKPVSVKIQGFFPSKITSCA